MKAMHRVALMAPAVRLLLTGGPLQASEMDKGIESSARKSYVFKTYLKGEDIKIRAEDGVSTSTETVADDSSKSLARKLWQDLKTRTTTGANIDEASITALVRMTLLHHCSTSALNCR
jgi:hyperosmotically inducible periplasmic protein